VWLDEKDKNGNPAALKNGKVARIPDERAFNLAERLRELGFDSRLDVYFKDAQTSMDFCRLCVAQATAGTRGSFGRETNILFEEPLIATWNRQRILRVYSDG
jgi:hypothetical protein